MDGKEDEMHRTKLLSAFPATSHGVKMALPVENVDVLIIGAGPAGYMLAK